MIRSLLLFFFISSIYAEPREGIDYVLIPEGLVKENGVTEVFGMDVLPVLLMKKSLMK